MSSMVITIIIFTFILEWNEMKWPKGIVSVAGCFSCYIVIFTFELLSYVTGGPSPLPYLWLRKIRFGVLLCHVLWLNFYLKTFFDDDNEEEGDDGRELVIMTQHQQPSHRHRQRQSRYHS